MSRIWWETNYVIPHRWIHGSGHEGDLHTSYERMGEYVYRMDYVSGARSVFYYFFVLLGPTEVNDYWQVLFLTGVLQIRYLNRALKRFDSKTVIPTQFVLFTLSAVVGSAVLYGDFRRATFHQMVTFLYGCAATFVGVYVIAWGSNSSEGETDGNTERGSGENDELRSAPGSEGSATVGSVRSRTSIVTSPKASGEVPVLRNKASTMSGVGYSPLQQVLVHTPPRDSRVNGEAGGGGSVSGNGRSR